MDNKALYESYLERLRLKLIKKYEELGLRASGSYEEELEAVVNGNKLTMLGANHSQFMENGRGQGSAPPSKIIEEWIENKRGLPSEFLENKKQFAFIIARKIALEGIKVPNENNPGRVVSEVVDEFLAEDIFEMIEELQVFWGDRFQSDIINILKSAA